MNHDQQTYPRLYLDEMTNPHFPAAPGALPATSKVLIPDLQRTGIRSKYSKNWPVQPFDVTGKMTQEFLTETASTLKSVPLVNMQVIYSGLRTNTNHRVNLSRALIEYEDSREERYQAMRRDVRKRTKDMGFGAIDSASMCLSPLALTAKSALAGKMSDGRGASHSPVRKEQIKQSSSSSSSSHRPLSRIAFFKSCLASTDPPKAFKKKRFGVLGRQTTLPIITPPVLSARREEDGGSSYGGYDGTFGGDDDAGAGATGGGTSAGTGAGVVGEPQLTTTEERYDDDEFDDTQEYNDPDHDQDQEFEGANPPAATSELNA